MTEHERRVVAAKHAIERAELRASILADRGDHAGEAEAIAERDRLRLDLADGILPRDPMGREALEEATALKRLNFRAAQDDPTCDASYYRKSYMRTQRRAEKAGRSARVARTARSRSPRTANARRSAARAASAAGGDDPGEPEPARGRREDLASDGGER